MKNALLGLLTLITFSAQAQKTEDKPLKIFKFHPFSLVTGSMSFSQEMYNKDKNKSTVISLGLRYINNENIAQDYSYSSAKPIQQHNKWTGGHLSVDRRFYVPAFQNGEKLSFINEKAQFGVYLSTGIKVDFNTNDYDKSFYGSIPDSLKQGGTKIQRIDNAGKIRYLGFMPNMNIGMQFTLFQNLYMDLFIGGGLRIVSKTIISQKQTDYASGYYYNNSIQTGAVENFIVREGVQPNFGFALGLNF